MDDRPVWSMACRGPVVRSFEAGAEHERELLPVANDRPDDYELDEPHTGGDRPPLAAATLEQDRTGSRRRSEPKPGKKTEDSAIRQGRRSQSVRQNRNHL